MERTVTIKKTGQQHHEVVYGVASLAPYKADAARLLRLVRQHWRIENKSHWVRDVTFDEDRSQVRRGTIPQMMAALRNVAIGLMRLSGHQNIAAATGALRLSPGLLLASWASRRRLDRPAGARVVYPDRLKFLAGSGNLLSLFSRFEQL